jgi:hypothetical protein
VGARLATLGEPRWYPWLHDRDGRPLASSIAILQKAVTFTVRRGFLLPSFSTCSSLLWGMTLVSLFLLPTDYRAGAETAHAHSLFQLWLDAADGSVFHEHTGQSATKESVTSTISWFDPTFALVDSDPHPASAHDSDLAHQQDSAPAISGIDILLTTLAYLPLLLKTRKPEPDAPLPLLGRFPQVLSPPPRSLLANV